MAVVRDCLIPGRPELMCFSASASSAASATRFSSRNLQVVCGWHAHAVRRPDRLQFPLFLEDLLLTDSADAADDDLPACSGGAQNRLPRWPCTSRSPIQVLHQEGTDLRGLQAVGRCVRTISQEHARWPANAMAV